MNTRRFIFTHLVALTGAISFLYLGLPLPWLFGPLFGCLVTALLGAKLEGYKPLSDGMRTILGVAVGATVTPSFFTSLPSLASTLIIVPIMTLMIGLSGVIYFRRLLNYDFPTAYYASMPGGLQDMIVFGEEAGANVRSISLIHATRVLIIVVILPILLTTVWQANLLAPPGPSVNSFDPTQITTLILCAIVGWRGAKAIGMFGASILGPMIVASIASLLGYLTTRPPAEAIWAAQYFIALSIGVKYVGITASELRRDVVAAIGFCAILICLTFIVVEGVLILGLAPPIEAILALTPGGQAEMVVLAIIVGADMTFVVAHHLLRLIFVITGAPIIAALLPKRFTQ